MSTTDAARIYEPEAQQDASAKAFARYDLTMRRRAWHIACGLSLLVLGPALGLMLEAVSPELSSPTNRLAVFTGVVGLVAGTILFYLGNRAIDEFVRSNPRIVDRYTASQQLYDARSLGIGVLVGVALIFAGAGIGGLMLAPENEQLGTSVLLLFLGASLWVFSYAVCLTGRSVFHSHGDGRVVDLRAERKRRETVGKVCFAVMAVATLAGLTQLTVGGVHSEFFWLAWALGGALCGLIAIVANARYRSSQGVIR